MDWDITMTNASLIANLRKAAEAMDAACGDAHRLVSKSRPGVYADVSKIREQIVEQIAQVMKDIGK